MAGGEARRHSAIRAASGSALVNATLVFGAAGITAVLSQSTGWLRTQRYVMGAVLAAIAVRIALTERK